MSAIKNIFFTGPPRSGKTTLLFRVIDAFKKHNIIVGGIYCPEIRERGHRIGFKIVDIFTGEEGILASVNIVSRIKVSKYYVNLQDLENIGAKAILRAIDDPEIQLIVIDEVGKMELFSEKFIKAVKSALDSNKPVLGVVSLKLKHYLVDHIKYARSDTKVYLIKRFTSEYERKRMLQETIEIILKYLGKRD